MQTGIVLGTATAAVVLLYQPFRVIVSNYILTAFCFTPRASVRSHRPSVLADCVCSCMVSYDHGSVSGLTASLLMTVTFTTKAAQRQFDAQSIYLTERLSASDASHKIVVS